MGRTREWRKRGGGPPLFAFEAAAGAPLVSILRFGPDLAASGGLPGAHFHDYLALAYFERDGGSLRLRTSRITSAPPRRPVPLQAWRRSEAQGCTAFGKLMSVANRDKSAVVLIARNEDQVARTGESQLPPSTLPQLWTTVNVVPHLAGSANSASAARRRDASSSALTLCNSGRSSDTLN